MLLFLSEHFKSPLVKAEQLLLIALLALGATSCNQKTLDQNQIIPPSDRTYLPVPNPESLKYSELDVRDTQKPEGFAGVKAPDGAPNVVLILVCFGEYIALDQIAPAWRQTGLEMIRTQR